MQPKLLAQQLKTAQRNMQSDTFTKEEKRMLNMQIQDLKRKQDELMYLEQMKLDEIKELKEFQKNANTQLLEAVLKEIAEKALET